MNPERRSWNERHKRLRQALLVGDKETATGNGITRKEVRYLSENVDPHYLRMYRIAVGRETRRVVKTLNSADYKGKVDPSRVRRIRDEAAVLSQAKSIVDYWASRTIGELLLMPSLRHCLLHLNEARRVRHTLLKKPGPE